MYTVLYDNKYGLIVYGNPDTEEIFIRGEKANLQIKSSSLIEFSGLSTTFLVHKTHPNGLTLISSDNSIPHFVSWKTLFSTSIKGIDPITHREDHAPSIWLDALMVTGWIRAY